MYYVEVDSSNSRRYGTATCGSLCFDLFCDVISSTTLNVFIYNAAQKEKCQQTVKIKNIHLAFISEVLDT
jgi:hypothetical protein